MTRALSVAWLGLRGFPGVQGGVESHAEQLCPMLQELGCEVTVLTRSPYQPASTGPRWRGVRLRRLWAPRNKHLEAVLHTFLAILYAGFIQRPDVLHIQAIGPGLWTLLARLLGLRVVVTHHGPDYERQKWGWLARSVLRLGEASAARWATELIVISRVIQQSVRQQHGRTGVLIANGLTPPTHQPGCAAVERLGLQPGRYLLLVSRLVPEKRHLDLIAAFQQAQLPGWQLALVGAADHADAYAGSVVKRADQTPGVVMTGFQTGEALQALYAHAGLFVLPSSHEGLPIAILEALSFGARVVASDIPANLEVGLPAECYFPLGDIGALSARLALATANDESPSQREARGQWAAEKFSWVRSARATQQVYARICGRPAPNWDGRAAEPQGTSDIR